MAAWMIAALALLAPFARSLVRQTPGILGGGVAGTALGGVGLPFGLGGAGAPFPLDERPRRRRRRRALTASDRADIGFITGLLGPTAGKNFAITIATRT